MRLLWTALLMAGCAAVEQDEVSPPADDGGEVSTQVTIVYQSRADGEIEPCG